MQQNKLAKPRITLCHTQMTLCCCLTAFDWWSAAACKPERARCRLRGRAAAPGRWACRAIPSTWTGGGWNRQQWSSPHLAGTRWSWFDDCTRAAGSSHVWRFWWFGRQLLGSNNSNDQSLCGILGLGAAVNDKSHTKISLGTDTVDGEFTCKRIPFEKTHATLAVSLI